MIPGCRLVLLQILLLCIKSQQTQFTCHSEDDIECKCERRGAKQIVLTNCTRAGGWSEWSKWTICEKRNTQRRRRRCDSPTPIGKRCEGKSVQTRRCSENGNLAEERKLSDLSKLPEYLWSSWSDWNEWGVCACPENQRRRTRRCIGWECSGCGVEHGPCERRCVTERWWSDWTEWLSSRSKTRHRSWCSLGLDGKSLITVVVSETFSTPSVDAVSTWSEWELRPGVAFRLRLPANSPFNASVDFEHQLIAYNSPTRVSITFCFYLSIAALISGFLTQSLISCLFSLCKSRENRY